MKKLSRSEVLAEALNCGAFQNDGSHQIPAGLLVTFEVDELMVFVETVVRESFGSKPAKFTPGPWRVGFSDGSGAASITAEDRCVVSGGESFGRDFGVLVPGDAMLIAAAPDLLADLKEAAATLRRYELSHRAKNTADGLAKSEVNATIASRFESTISKATGCPTPGSL